MLKEYDYPEDDHADFAGCHADCDFEFQSKLDGKPLTVHGTMGYQLRDDMPAGTTCVRCNKPDPDGHHFECGYIVYRVEVNGITQRKRSQDTKRVAKLLRAISADKFVTCSNDDCYDEHCDNLIEEFAAG